MPPGAEPFRDHLVRSSPSRAPLIDAALLAAIAEKDAFPAQYLMLRAAERRSFGTVTVIRYVR